MARALYARYVYSVLQNYLIAALTCNVPGNGLLAKYGAGPVVSYNCPRRLMINLTRELGNGEISGRKVLLGQFIFTLVASDYIWIPSRNVGALSILSCTMLQPPFSE